MKPSISTPIHQASLLWVRMTTPQRTTYWARASRLLMAVTQSEQMNVFNRLRNGQPIVFEGSGILLEYIPMSNADQKRLSHLLRFEMPGCRLSTFEGDTALFSDENGQEYSSMNEMLERGYIPRPTISINPNNIKYTTFHGKLLDIFVPVGEISLNFSALSNEPVY